MGFTKSSYDQQLKEDQRLEVFLSVCVCVSLMSACMSWQSGRCWHNDINTLTHILSFDLAWFYYVNRAAGLWGIHFQQGQLCCGGRGGGCDVKTWDGGVGGWCTVYLVWTLDSHRWLSYKVQTVKTVCMTTWRLMGWFQVHVSRNTRSQNKLNVFKPLILSHKMVLHFQEKKKTRFEVEKLWAATFVTKWMTCGSMTWS